jgi:hypothetical protein
MTLNIKRFSVMVVAGLFVAASVPAFAGMKRMPNVGDKVSSEKHPVAASVETLHTAEMLLRYGYANKDPLALITGAKMKKASGATETVFERLSGKPGAAKSKADVYSVEAALAEARTLAAGRADLIGLADDVAKMGGRGAVGGGKTTTTVVDNRAVDNFKVRFEGGEPARIVVSGDGDSDLDLYVYDENDNLVCSDNDSSDDMICSWTPRWTGTFKVRVRNMGMANRYTLVTN